MKKTLLSLAFAGALLASAQQPGFHWAKSLGGTGYESPAAITTDASGNVYTIGGFYNTTDFDPGPGISNLTCIGSADIFISKLDASGNFLWAKQIGSATDEFAFGISVDANGNVYSTGSFDGTTDFDPGPLTYTLSATSFKDQFILKLDANGNFVWAKQIGGIGVTAIGFSIGLDSNGDVYTTGTFDGVTDFDPGVGSYTLTSLGNTDVFVSKTDANGNFVWANSFGSVGNDFVRTMSLDASGTVYIIGGFANIIDLDPSVNSYTLAPIGGSDMFISVLDGSGNFIFAKQIGSPIGSQFVYSSAIDSQNNIYIAGFFSGTMDFDPSASVSNLNAIGNDDAYILKLDPAGQYLWAKNIGGTSASCFARSIKTDAIFNVYIAGYYNAPVDFDPGPVNNTINVSGFQDAYLLKLDPLGNFTWVKKFGGNGADLGLTFTLDQASNIHLAGRYEQSADFDPTAGIATLSSTGGSDVFIVKLNQSLVGLEEKTVINTIDIFPNPAKDILNIKLDEEMLNTPAKIEIYNALGQLILTESVTSQDLKLNIKNLNTGLFVLKIIDGTNIISTKKIIKE